MSSVAKALKAMKYPFRVFTGKDIKTNLKALKPHFELLKDDLQLQTTLKLPTNQIMRKRSMMGFNVEFDTEGKITSFQDAYKRDILKPGQTVLRNALLYEEFSNDLKQDPEFKNFIYNTLRVVQELKQIKRATIQCHAIRTISYHDQPAQPTPEGPHKDGVDFEVLAVVNKENCQGAESQIFTPNKTNLLFEMTLDPGEGYFIDGLNLWNYATDHHPVDEHKVGVRDLLGYLLKIEEQHQ